MQSLQCLRNHSVTKHLLKVPFEGDHPGTDKKIKWSAVSPDHPALCQLCVISHLPLMYNKYVQSMHPVEVLHASTLENLQLHMDNLIPMSLATD